jgi:hypothetical protein
MVNKMVEKRIDELIKIINEADYNYHTLDNPIQKVLLNIYHIADSFKSPYPAA